MGERPIIFSAPMVRAILAGRKTMTRRLLRKAGTHNGEAVNYNSPYRKMHSGDRLWVRENLRVVSEGIEYAADDTLLAETEAEWSDRAAELWNRYAHDYGPDLHPTLIPSIHMPRWASRITLEVTAIKVERLQDISEEDAEAEGVDPVVAGRTGWSEPILTHRTGFVRIWNELHGDGAWLANPEVVAISFRRPDVQ